MAILLYLYSSVSLLTAFWLHRPFLSCAVLLFFHLWYTWVFDRTGYSFDDVIMWKPLALLLGTAGGGALAYVLNMPRVIYTWVQPWWYLLSLAILLLLQMGSWLTWQLAPAAWWNYVFLGIVLQALLVVVSYLALPHDKMWNGLPGCSLRVHYHFLVTSVLFTTLPYAIGSAVNPGLWPFWYAAISGLSVFGWAVLHHQTAYDAPASHIALVGTLVRLETSIWEDRFM